MYPATVKAAPGSGDMLDALATALSERMGVRTKAFPSTTPSVPYMFGPNGLWSHPGLERPIISTRVIPRGIAGMIPARPTNTMNPLYPYLTGFSDPAEVQPNGVCDDPPTPGSMMNCLQTATWGRYGYQTRVIDITRLGQIINRGEFTDLMLMNNPIGFEGDNSIITPGTMPGALELVNEVNVRFTELGIKFQNKLSRQIWEGNPANNTAGGGYMEFPGLDTLISTGKRDAVTNALCPSLDSIIIDQAYKRVDDVSGTNPLITVLTYVWRILNNLASRTGLAPVQWAVVMREELFYELTQIWPCNYLTYRCIAMAGTASELVNPTDAVGMRDAMRQGQYLVIDGQHVGVVLDDALREETTADNVAIAAGAYASDIKILPMTVQGNKAALFWEYYDWGGPNAAMNLLGDMPMMGNYFWSDGGQYLWHAKPPNNWCVQWMGMIRPRLVLLTPHLAATINNIQYAPFMHPRDAFPDQPNFVAGGVASRTSVV